MSPTILHSRLLLAAAAIAWAVVCLPTLRADDPSASRDLEGADSPAEREAGEFLSLLVLGEKDQIVTALRQRPPLVKIRELHAKGQNLAALEVFRDYYLHKLRFPEQVGLDLHAVNPYVNGVTMGGDYPGAVWKPHADLEQVRRTADDLMAGKMQIGGATVVIGEPGQVDWTLAPAPTDKEPRPLPHQALVNSTGFRVLAQAYLLTGESAYLDRWLAYMDDWSTRCDYYKTIEPVMVGDRDAGAILIATQTIRILAAIAQMTRDNQRIPAATLARILSKIVREQLPPNILYTRSNTHNWTPGAHLLLMALLVDEFQIAPVYFREGRRRQIEDNAVTQNLRDGTETQQDPWYNTNFFGVAEAFTLLDNQGAIEPWNRVSWVRDLADDRQWRQEIQEHLDARVRFFLHIRTPQGEYPIGIRGGDKRHAHVPTYRLSPASFADPVSTRILRGAPHPDGYRSSAFPYAGYFLVRRGWQKTSGYGFLFCSPQPGAYGAFRSRSNNNTFGLSDFGQELLTEHVLGHYMYPDSPVRVDGRDQFFHAGLYKVPAPAPHKVYQVSAWTEPADWRWHESPRFNVMEGVYAGPYGDINDRPVIHGAYGQDASMEETMRLDETIRDVTHQRLVQHVVDANLWIVTDRLSSPTSHQYEQLWRLPVAPGGTPTFQVADIQVDAAARRIVTRSEAQDKANISLYQFSAADLSYSRATTEKDPKNRYQAYGWETIRVTWTGEGAQQIVTLAYPRAAGAPDLAAVDGDASGFTVQTPDGQTVSYRAAATPGEALRIGDVVADAGSLLLTAAGGIALDCRSLSIGGEPLAIPGPDFEFDLQTRATRPVYRPIRPVAIMPAAEVFAGSQTVTLQCDTPAVAIHYTLDGTEPTPQSTVYDGPFTLTATTVLKARAYRPEVTANPPGVDGVLASPVSRAVYTRVDPTPPSKVRTTAAGLSYRYFEGQWQDLWLFRDRLPAAATGVAPLFDLSVVPATNPPVGTAAAPRQRHFAIEYSGYIQIPTAGVYTLHAPRELVWPDTEAGYDLQVYLGDRSIPWGGRRDNYGLNQWYPATRLQALGTWSIALAPGWHAIRIVYVDYRGDSVARWNRPGLRDYVWGGVTPDLRISGPDLPAQPIPESWLSH